MEKLFILLLGISEKTLGIMFYCLIIAMFIWFAVILILLFKEHKREKVAKESFEKIMKLGDECKCKTFDKINDVKIIDIGQNDITVAFKVLKGIGMLYPKDYKFKR